MTPKALMDLVDNLDRTSTLMVRWIRVGSTLRDALVGDAVIYDCARLAGHYANRLIDLAERGEGRAA